jgi:hypothetical protein
VDSDFFFAINVGGVLFIDNVCDCSISCRYKLWYYICFLTICRGSSVGVVTKQRIGFARIRSPTVGKSSYSLLGLYLIGDGDILLRGKSHGAWH